MATGSLPGDPQPPSMSTTVPDLINWPVQKRKMWQGKGHLPPWVEIRRIAGKAIDDGLQTHTLQELVDIIKQPCKDAGLKAARNKRDKDAQLKREYHNMVMGLLHEALERQAEVLRVREEVAALALGENTSVTCSRSYGGGIDRTDGVGTAAGRGTQRLKPLQGMRSVKVDIAELTGRIERLQVEGAKQRSKRHAQAYVEVEAPSQSVGDIPQHTGFYASLFKGFFNPPALSMPSSNTKQCFYKTAENEGVDTMLKARKEPEPMRMKEAHGDNLNKWVDVEKDLDSEWESVTAKT